jgi:Carboxypeptidase regulatory-like domain/TonB dependent receptor
MFSMPGNSAFGRMGIAVAAFGFMTAMPAMLRAQSTNRVSGLITDQSGSVIVGAAVSAQDVATNVVSNTTSNDRGYYLLQLPIGFYSIKVSNTGFRSSLRERVEVSVGADVGLDFTLALASAEQSVEVVGGISPLLAPNSSSVETVVENELVLNLPLAVSGGMRNSADFLKLTPGYQGTTFSARLNGGVGLDQEVTIDGATVSPVAFGAGIQGSQNTVPGFAVQEFQVVGSNIEAQYGRTSTGVIKYVYKSGTNALHGSAFEYLRNESLDARNFFSPTVAKDHQNEFGVEAGGPVFIPKLYNGKNRTFFYMYYDGFRYSNSNPGSIYSLLTPSMRQGDFSAAGIPVIYDPSTTRSDGKGGFVRDPFAGNIIPQSQISPISSYFASLLPNPTLPGLSSNFKGLSTSTNNMDQGLIKIDQSFHNGRFSASYNHTTEPTVSQGPFGAILSGTFGNNQGRRAIVNWDQTISANKLNHFGASFNRWSFFNHQGNQTDLSTGSNLNQKAGLGGILDQTGQATVNASGYFLGIGGEVNRIAHQNWRITDDFNWIKGSHDYQFGISQTRYYTTGLQQAGGFTPFGTFSFGPQETGLPGNPNSGFGVASYLLGQVDSATYGQQPSQAFLFRNWGVYAQDRWKVRPNLTLTYGLRWEYEPPIRDKLDRLANFDPTLANPGAGNLPGALVFAGSGSGRTGKDQFANSWDKGFGPRVGVAYSFRKDMVLRAAYGVVYDTNAGPAIFLNQQGYFTQASVFPPFRKVLSSIRPLPTAPRLPGCSPTAPASRWWKTGTWGCKKCSVGCCWTLAM